jgi:hypothetical protein
MLNFVRLNYGYYASLIGECGGVRRSLVGRVRSGGWRSGVAGGLVGDGGGEFFGLH